MCIPIMKQISLNGQTRNYYFGLSFLFAFVIPQLMLLCNDFGGKWSNQVLDAIHNDISTMNLKLVLGFSAYFMLGYYLNQIELSKRKRTLIYIGGILGFLLTAGLDSLVAIQTNTPCGTYYDAFTINVLMQSVAVFTFFKYHSFQKKRCYPWVVKLSKYSFGAYLVHVLILEQMKRYVGLNTQSFPAILSVPLLTILIFFCSFVVSAFLNHVPVLKNYIV